MTALAITPVGSYEDQIFQRIMAAIPPGLAYTTSGPNPRPIEARTAFLITGTMGLRVRVYLNGGFVSEIGIDSVAVRLTLGPLTPWPDVNWVRVVDDVGEEASIGVSLSYQALVHKGAALDYFRHTYLDYLVQYWSLTSRWSSRPTEFRFKYHQSLPDTQALRALAVKLLGRAVFHGAPTTLGIDSIASAFSLGSPVIVPMMPGSVVDPAIHTLWPAPASYHGYEFNVWLPDLPTARERALWQLAANVPQQLRLRSAVEATSYIGVGMGSWDPTDEGDEPGWQTVLHSYGPQHNLQYLLGLIGTMDAWLAFVSPLTSVEVARRFWSYRPDTVVMPPGLGAGTPFDGGTFDSGSPLDSGEPFTELWTGCSLTPFDSDVWADSVVSISTELSSQRRDPPAAFEWEWAMLGGSCSTTAPVSNSLHGGAPPDFETA